MSFKDLLHCINDYINKHTRAGHKVIWMNFIGQPRSRVLHQARVNLIVMVEEEGGRGGRGAAAQQSIFQRLLIKRIKLAPPYQSPLCLKSSLLIFVFMMFAGQPFDFLPKTPKKTASLCVSLCQCSRGCRGGGPSECEWNADFEC